MSYMFYNATSINYYFYDKSMYDNKYQKKNIYKNVRNKTSLFNISQSIIKIEIIILIYITLSIC
jgi:hypothetical protein